MISFSNNITFKHLNCFFRSKNPTYKNSKPNKYIDYKWEMIPYFFKTNHMLGVIKVIPKMGISVRMSKRR